MTKLADVARAEAALLKALAAAEADPDPDPAVVDAASETYDEACYQADICYAIGCTTTTEWCAYCDEHCEYPEHLPHADN